jgi:NAD(P)-dependent dehydrogenase (short-subunit alcohol dehydrogenase family)
MSEVALITGANRGLGLGLARALASQGWVVGLAARREADASAAAAAAGPLRGLLVPLAVDVTRPEQVRAAVEALVEAHGGLNAVVSNAGAILDQGGVLTADPDTLLRSFELHTLGLLHLAQASAAHLRRSRGNLVAVSTGMAGLTEMGGGWPAYRTSKTALNALVKVLHHELNPQGVRVNAVCPGWVRTRMGGPGATRSLEEGVAGLLWAATLPPGGPSGGFFRDGQPLPW